MVELLAQFARSDDVGEADAGRAVVDAERDLHVAMAAEDRLRHQKLVEIRIQNGPDDRIDLPGMVVDPGRDVRHRLLLATHGRRDNNEGPLMMKERPSGKNAAGTLDPEEREAQAPCPRLNMGSAEIDLRLVAGLRL